MYCQVLVPQAGFFYDRFYFLMVSLQNFIWNHVVLYEEERETLIFIQAQE